MKFLDGGMRHKFEFFQRNSICFDYEKFLLEYHSTPTLKEIIMNKYVMTKSPVMTLTEAFKYENNLFPILRGFNCEEDLHLTCAPVINMLTQGDFPRFFADESSQDHPFLLVFLPNFMRDDFLALSNSQLIPVNVTSNDLKDKMTCVALAGVQHEIQIAADKVYPALAALVNIGLEVVMVCGDQLRIIRHQPDPDYKECLGLLFDESGGSYTQHFHADVGLRAVCPREASTETVAVQVWRPRVFGRVPVHVVYI